jgi:hypothetical protein
MKINNFEINVYLTNQLSICQYVQVQVASSDEKWVSLSRVVR